MDLLKKEYTGVTYISGPLLFVENAKDLAYGAIVDIKDGTGRVRGGQVIEVSEEYAVIQVFEETTGLDLATTSVSLVEDVARLGVSKEMLGRRFNGIGKPIDGLPPITPEKRLPIVGLPLNPVARRKPEEFIQTGISTIDVMNTLVRGQKLPIFSGSGLPANEIAAQIARQATVRPDLSGEGEKEEPFAVVFAAMGITQRELSYFIQEFERTGALSRSVLFLNKADDPTIERILTPRMALTVAEYLAFEHDYHVLVILTDMTNYCEALREIGAGPRGDPRPPRLPRLHVHRPGHHLRAGRGGAGQEGLGDPDPHPLHARRRPHPPHPRPHGLHHRGADPALPGAAPQGHLPAH
jgi:V/A-type H+-transporting ATPase subunit B